MTEQKHTTQAIIENEIKLLIKGSLTLQTLPIIILQKNLLKKHNIHMEARHLKKVMLKIITGEQKEKAEKILPGFIQKYIEALPTNKAGYKVYSAKKIMYTIRKKLNLHVQEKKIKKLVEALPLKNLKITVQKKERLFSPTLCKEILAYFKHLPPNKDGIKTYTNGDIAAHLTEKISYKTIQKCIEFLQLPNIKRVTIGDKNNERYTPLIQEYFDSLKKDKNGFKHYNIPDICAFIHQNTNTKPDPRTIKKLINSFELKIIKPFKKKHKKEPYREEKFHCVAQYLNALPTNEHGIKTYFIVDIIKYIKAQTHIHASRKRIDHIIQTLGFKNIRCLKKRG